MTIAKQRTAHNIERERTQALPGRDAITGSKLFDGNEAAFCQHGMIARQLNTDAVHTRVLNRAITQAEHASVADMRLVPAGHTARHDPTHIIHGHDAAGVLRPHETSDALPSA